MSDLDDIDRKILNRIQSNFPINPRPYRAVAEELDLSEDEVLVRLQRLKQCGIIRRVGGNFVPEKLGFVSTLCAAQVPVDKIGRFAAVVNSFPGVTHNYERDNRFNIWFTFIAPSRQQIEDNLEAIRRQTGISAIINLPATKVYKIRAHFDLAESGTGKADDEGL